MDIIDAIENLELIKKLGDYDGIHLNYRNRGYYTRGHVGHMTGYYCKCGTSKRRLKKCECNFFEMTETSGSRSNDNKYVLKYSPHECTVTKEKDGLYKVQLTSLYVEKDPTLKKLLLTEKESVYLLNLFNFEKTVKMVDGEATHKTSYMCFNEYTVRILEIIRRKMPSETALINDYFHMIRCVGSLNYGFHHESRMSIVDGIENVSDKSIMEYLEIDRSSSKTTERMLRVFSEPSLYEAFKADTFLFSFCAMIDTFQSSIATKKDLLKRVPDSVTELIGFLEAFSPKDLNQVDNIHNFSKNLNSNDFAHILEVGEITGLGFLGTVKQWKLIDICFNDILKVTVFEVEDDDIPKARQELIGVYKKYLKEVKGYVSYSRDGLTHSFKDWYFFNQKDPIQKIRDFAQHQLLETLKEELPSQKDKFEICLDLIDTDVIKALELLSSNKVLTKKDKEELAKLM